MCRNARKLFELVLCVCYCFCLRFEFDVSLAEHFFEESRNLYFYTFTVAVMFNKR